MRYIHHIQHCSAVAIILFLTIVNLISCSRSDTDSQLKAVVDSFATHYYNWQFKQALPYCTPESESWLRFAATNVQQSDVDILRAQDEGASYQINDIKFGLGDSTAIVSLTVSHYLRMDTVGNAGQFVNKADFQLPVVCRNGRWMVHLTALPYSQNGRPTAK